MSKTQTITVNGRQYDARTGLLITTSESAAAAPAVTEKPASRSHVTPKPRSVASANMHTSTQRSKTLNRKAIQRPRPVAQKAAATPAATPSVVTSRPRPTAPAASAATRSTHITKFAPHPVIKPAQAQMKAKPQSMDIGPVQHPHVTKAHAVSLAKAQAKTTTPTPKPSHVVKSEAIQTAIENTRKHPVKAKQRFLKRHPRAMTIVSATFALVLLSGYLTYLNMPSLSVRVAAAQAGINAEYPSYRPDGYSLSGPVAYSQGEVTMKFAANGGPQHFTITQTKSSWDSASVLDNYVAPKAGTSYIPYTERGLTIYTFESNAAWVNGGILYTIEGDAPLSSDQIRRIATSLI